MRQMPRLLLGALREGALVDERPRESRWRLRALWFLLGLALGLLFLWLAMESMERQIDGMERRLVYPHDMEGR